MYLFDNLIRINWRTIMQTLQHPALTPAHGQAPANAMEPFPAEVANFNLLQSTNNTNPNAPHYFGSFKLEGKWYQVSTWIQYSRQGGQQMLSNSVRPCTAQEAARHEERDAQFRARANGGQQQAGQARQYTPVQGNPLDAQPAPAAAPAVDPALIAAVVQALGGHSALASVQPATQASAQPAAAPADEPAPVQAPVMADTKEPDPF
ncbi:hypothetical protein HOR75_gp40 [Shewanella phage SppYZU05]|uniref:Uncharacterized protein n=1 Tax=Shewanella phage SppYZU05 TaxID=1970795 RepID=A0A1W6JTI3_9CAUD|nr:hypothetical protein HOR75_gp40 [Shewanella phage SppYZU05]ARM70566.1 hypothetical protein SppYZU05_40 [Shewanella phage SppYZU05]